MWGKTEQVQTTGKNLFSSLYDEYTLPSNYYIYPLVLEKGETYTVSLKSISTTKNIVIYIVKSGNMYPFEQTSILANLLNLNDTLGNNKARFTVDETFTAPAIAIYAESKESFDSIFEAKEIQLEKNSVATSYEPYTGGKPSPSPDWKQPIEVTDRPVTVTIKGGTEQQSITLVPPRPLTKWDKLEKIDGVWKWGYQGKTDKLISFDSKFADEELLGKTFCRYQSNVNPGFSRKRTETLCTKLRNNKQEDSVFFNTLGAGYIVLYFDKKLGIDTLEKANNWISLNNDISFAFCNVAKNPEYIPLSQPEQDKLNSLTMYAPTTEITNDGGCNMELTYTVDTKSYVDAKIAEISKAIL